MKKDIAIQQAKNAIKWLNELSVTSLKKGTGRLEKNDKFCCIGVGCKLFGLPTKTNSLRNKEWAIELQRMLGLRPYNSGDCCPVKLNDVYRKKDKTFKEMSKLLRKPKHVRASFKPEVAELIIEKLKD